MAPPPHPLALLAMAVATAAIQVVPLDMAPDSLDAQYLSCAPHMAQNLAELTRSDFLQNAALARAWPKAVAEWQRRGSPRGPLSPAQAVALTLYTMKAVHRQLNAAVRRAGRCRRHYRQHFHFKALHFLLSRALQRLREPGRCLQVFRGVRGLRFQARPGDRVRFGRFASASRSAAVAAAYGTHSTFRLRSCHGADIQEFSSQPADREVLVPPFETFEVTAVTREGDTVTIDMRSVGNVSLHDCEWLRGDNDTGDEEHCEVTMAQGTGTLRGDNGTGDTVNMELGSSRNVSLHDCEWLRGDNDTGDKEHCEVTKAQGTL